MNSRSDPLLDVALNYIQNDNQIEESSIEAIRSALSNYISGQTDLGKCTEELRHYANNLDSLEKISAILSIGADPLPISMQTQGGHLKGKSNPWTAIEDQRLLLAIHKFGLESWNNVAEFVGAGRTRSQCSQRWNRGLINPRISRMRWTPNEEKLLIEYVKEYGDKAWTKVSSLIGTRSDAQCRYKYFQIQKESLPPIIHHPKIPMQPHQIHAPTPTKPAQANHSQRSEPPSSIFEDLAAENGGVDSIFPFNGGIEPAIDSAMFSPGV